MDLLSTTFARRPGLFAAIALALSIAAALGISRVRFSESPRALFRSGDAASAELERLYAHFGSDDADCIVLLESPDVLNNATCALIREDPQTHAWRPTADPQSNASSTHRLRLDIYRMTY